MDLCAEEEQEGLADLCLSQIFCIAQKRVEDKSNEITAIPAALDSIDITFNLKKLCKNLLKEAFAALFGKLKLYVRILFFLKSQLSFPQAKVSQKCCFNMKNVA
ncbi:MAG: hypothetical protein LBL07_09615 [Tannerella sp.]|nr:hypothetical protein [Tannerella sp.]